MLVIVHRHGHVVDTLSLCRIRVSDDSVEIAPSAPWPTGGWTQIGWNHVRELDGRTGRVTLRGNPVHSFLVCPD